MKREKRLTKKERKAQAPAQAQASGGHQHQGHIHCIACGKHLDAEMFGEADGAEFIRCDHGSDFPSCIGCHAKSKALIAEHDKTNKPVQKAAAWH
jgi:ribosomal protein L32